MSGTSVVLIGGQPVWNVAAVAPTPEMLAMLGSKSYHVLASGVAAATLVVLIPGARFRRREDEESRTPEARVAAGGCARAGGTRARAVDEALNTMDPNQVLLEPLDDAAMALAARRCASVADSPSVDLHALALEADWGDRVLSPMSIAAPLSASGGMGLGVTPSRPSSATRAHGPCTAATLARRRAVRAARMTVLASARPSERSSWRWRLPLAAALMTLCAWFGLLAWRADRAANAGAATNPVAASSESPSGWAFTTYTKGIERVAPGELVPADRLHGDNDLSLGVMVDPPTWRRIVLRCPKVDGGHADGNLLRPLWWLREQLDATRAMVASSTAGSVASSTDDDDFSGVEFIDGLSSEGSHTGWFFGDPMSFADGSDVSPAPSHATLTPEEISRLERELVGAKLYIAVPECGIDGLAEVLEVGPCPAIQNIPGTRVVTGTWRHHSAHVIDLWIEGLDGPIGTTANHPFWSEDRLAFVRADELRDGERLHLLSGQTTSLARHAARPGLHEVFNLEVQCDHVYHISASGVLVHNGVAWNALCRLLAQGGKKAANKAFPKDFATRNTRNWSSAFRSEGEARTLARTKLGKNPVEIEPGKWRSADGKWQYRAKPGDLTEDHIHLEELDSVTGEVLQNLHLRWPNGAGR